MDKKTIDFLKRRYPQLFSSVVKSPILSRMAMELDRGRYISCLLNQKPYFGTVALAGQTWESRKTAMKALISQEVQRVQNYFSLLEIGSYAADSAVLWAQAIKANSQKGVVLCIDPWEAYVKTEDKEEINSATIIMNENLRKGNIFKLFLHNVKTTGHADIIYPLKGYSDKILPLLASNSFYVIYVDGDHSYSGIKKDLLNATRLVKEGGVLCGDDLDLTVGQIDRIYAQEHKEINIVVDPKTNQVYHPGVTLAVAEFFDGEVSSWNGFWAMRKKGSSWEKISLSV